MRYRKSFSRAEMHNPCEALLKKLTPSAEIIDIASAVSATRGRSDQAEPQNELRCFVAS